MTEKRKVWRYIAIDEQKCNVHDLLEQYDRIGITYDWFGHDENGKSVIRINISDMQESYDTAVFVAGWEQ